MSREAEILQWRRGENYGDSPGNAQKQKRRFLNTVTNFKVFPHEILSLLGIYKKNPSQFDCFKLVHCLEQLTVKVHLQ